MNLASTHQNPTMSSREIAVLVESRHDKVKQSIERLVERGVIQSPPMGNFKNINNVDGTEYHLCKRDSYVVVAQLSPEFTARLVDRWQALESSQISSLPSYPDALRQLASSLEQNERMALQLEEQKPAVEFVDRFVEAKSAKGLREVAKILGRKEREFINELAEAKVIFKLAGNWVAMAEYQHSGYFEVKVGEANGHAYKQLRFTPEGLVWVAQKHGRKLI